MVSRQEPEPTQESWHSHESLPESLAAEAFAPVVASALHDLRNLLCAVRLAAGQVRLSAPEVTDLADSIESLTGRAGRQLGELQDFVLSTVSRQRELLDLGALVVSVVAQHRPALSAADIEVRLVAEAMEVVADRAALERMLDNLITNAREAMPDGGTLTVRTCCVDDIARLSIEDTGIGMAPEVAAAMFRPFYTHGKIGGTGLGAAFVQSVARAHAGTVEVQSQPGRGTLVTVQLPRHRGSRGWPSGAGDRNSQPVAPQPACVVTGR